MIDYSFSIYSAFFFLTKKLACVNVELVHGQLGILHQEVDIGRLERADESSEAHLHSEQIDLARRHRSAHSASASSSVATAAFLFFAVEFDG